MQLGIVSFPYGGSALIEEIAADEKSIADTAEPCDGWSDVHVVEKVVGRIRDERAVLDIGTRECHGGAGVFKDSVVGDGAGEESRIVGDADLFRGGVGDVA